MTIYSIIFVIIFLGSIYFFLKDDYRLMKKTKVADGLDGGQMLKQYHKNRINTLIFFLEAVAIYAVWFLLMFWIMDVQKLQLPNVVIGLLIPLCILPFLISRAKVRLRKSIEIFSNPG